MSAGISQATQTRLNALGIEVIQLSYENMYLGGGGIHCSTCLENSQPNVSQTCCSNLPGMPLSHCPINLPKISNR